MAMGQRKRERQETFWVATSELPQTPGHPFYERLNKILDGQGFDRFVQERCRKFYADQMGRPSLPPAIYFRMLLVGYFEGIDSERGIAWRVADSMALRRFLGFGLSGQHQAHPVSMELPGGFGPDAAGSPSDNRGFALQIHENSCAGLQATGVSPVRGIGLADSGAATAPASWRLREGSVKSSVKAAWGAAPVLRWKHSRDD